MNVLACTSGVQEQPGRNTDIVFLASCIFQSLSAFPYRLRLLVSAESSSITSKHLRVWLSVPTAHSKSRGFERS